MLQIKKLQDTSIDWAAKIKDAEQQPYINQPELTQKLDNHIGDFTESTLLEIVLWKNNRYPTITEGLITDINDFSKSYSEEKARNLLRELLNLRGFDLPMASTVLRFGVPNELQIIDQRAYRIITPDKRSLRIPTKIEAKIELYFDYIKLLKSICEDYHIPFHNADRLFYKLDKIENKTIPLTTNAKH